MNLDKNLKNIYMSNIELDIICFALVEFAQEMHWKLRSSNEKNNFISKFREKFDFFLIELDYVKEAIVDLRFNLKSISIEMVQIHISDESHIPKKPLIFYAALSECSKNYEDYEIGIRTGFSKEELDVVLKEFKEKVIDKLEYLKDI
jgi:hypothetical protein